jgi:hypothetical protein
MFFGSTMNPTPIGWGKHGRALEDTRIGQERSFSFVASFLSLICCSIVAFVKPPPSRRPPARNRGISSSRMTYICIHFFTYMVVYKELASSLVLGATWSRAPQQALAAHGCGRRPRFSPFAVATSVTSACRREEDVHAWRERPLTGQLQQ